MESQGNLAKNRPLVPSQFGFTVLGRIARLLTGAVSFRGGRRLSVALVLTKADLAEDPAGLAAEVFGGLRQAVASSDGLVGTMVTVSCVPGTNTPGQSR